ncbi:IS701 family transposase [Streptosporangium subroseum]|jgi:SRSO17 transposase|uniref:IS701 family transposase n=1 Tax=Streptosporangium subroseum TaxID=106412 RepID=UPI0030929B33|nr:transposase [Streptosporangium subroseum]
MAIYSDLASRGVWLSPLCEDLFYSFLRSDQRRWGEVYVQGLVSVPGRKSIRRISDHVMGRPVDQCLQQFINQSPWDWGPVRQRLAQRLVETIRPKAWVLEEVVFPKNGSDSVGVARQFVNSAGRLINCQVGLAVVLVGEDGGCPVNWRLLLPRSWDEDDTRRGRTRLPAHERSRPRWQHLLELIDEMMIDWGLPPAPVVIDARAIQGVEPLIRGLADRGLPYMVRVAQNRLSSIAPRLPARPMPDPVRTRLHAVQGSGHPQPYEVGRHRHHGVERQATRQGPRPIWLTDLGRSRQPDLAGLVSLRKKAVTELSTAEEESGLQHFEGRSFQGWHHHVTLVSVAHAYRMLRRLDGENVEERCLRPHG